MFEAYGGMRAHSRSCGTNIYALLAESASRVAFLTQALHRCATHWRRHAAPLGIAQQASLGLGRFTISVGQRDQFFLAPSSHTDHDQ